MTRQNETAALTGGRSTDYAPVQDAPVDSNRPDSDPQVADRNSRKFSQVKGGVIAVIEVSADLRLHLVSSRDGARLSIETHVLGSNGWKVAGATTSFAARILPHVVELTRRGLAAVDRRA